LNNALIDGGDELDVNVTKVSDVSQTGNDNGADINTLLTRIVGTLAAGTHNAQSGDSFSRIGATGSGLTSLAQASVLGALADAAADGDPTATDTLMQYIKQLINVLVGSAGVVAYPAAADPANGVNLAAALRAVRDDVTGINGDVMRGTDGASTHGDPDPSNYIDAAISGRATPAQVNTEVDNALNTAIPGTPTADSINERLKRLEEDVTPTRAGNLDNLDASVASRSSHGDPDPSNFIDAAISSRSSHGDPDPSNFIDAAISGRAVAGDQMDFVDAPNATAIAAIQNGLSVLTAAGVNAEILDVLTVDVFAQPGAVTPAATTTILLMLQLVYKFLVNPHKDDTNTGQQEIYDPTGSNVEQKSSLSDVGGIFSKGQMVAGP
jgi:hypothetical protein